MVNKFVRMYACSHGGSWEHVICCKCCEPCDLLLWIYELELDKVGYHPYQFHGNCIYANTCWWIHIWYLLVKVQNLCRLRIHRITGTFFYKKNSEIEWIFFLTLANSVTTNSTLLVLILFRWKTKFENIPFWKYMCFLFVPLYHEWQVACTYDYNQNN